MGGGGGEVVVCWLREFDGDFFSIFFLSGLHELFLIEKSLEIAA